MAKENEDGTEKTEEPTAKRKSKARQDGNVAKSQDVNVVAGLFVGLIYLLLMGPTMAKSLAFMMKKIISQKALISVNQATMVTLLKDMLMDISAILLDLTMPKLDGQQCLKQIREIDPEIPVILSSGFSEEESMKQFQDSGINSFIQKPYQVEVLIEKIQALIPDIVLQENPFP